MKQLFQQSIIYNTYTDEWEAELDEKEPHYDIKYPFLLLRHGKIEEAWKEWDKLRKADRKYLGKNSSSKPLYELSCNLAKIEFIILTRLQLEKTICFNELEKLFEHSFPDDYETSDPYAEGTTWLKFRNHFFRLLYNQVEKDYSKKYINGKQLNAYSIPSLVKTGSW